MRFVLVVLAGLFVSGCGLSEFHGRNISPLFSSRKKRDAGLTFALTSREVDRMRRETYERILHRPYPPEEERMRERVERLGAPRRTPERPRVKPLVSPEGFPLVSLRGRDMTLGNAIEFAAGSAGYRVEWADGVNLALPVTVRFQEEPLDKVVTSLLRPFGYFGLVDGKKGIVRIGLSPLLAADEGASSEEAQKRGLK